MPVCAIPALLILSFLPHCLLPYALKLVNNAGIKLDPFPGFEE